MTDLRKAAEMALEALELGDDISAEQMSDALEALRQALAQPEQEPVAYEVDADVINSHGQSEYRTFLAYRPDPAMTTGGIYEVTKVLEARPLYTAPPISDYHEGWEEGFKAGKHEWVGLTDDEVIKCFDSVAFGQVEDDLIINKHVNIFRAIHAIEAKLKEKNT